MTLDFIRAMISPYRAKLALLCGLLVGRSAITLLIPWIAGMLGSALFADFIAQPAGGGLALLLAAILGLLTLNAGLTIASNTLQLRVQESILADLRRRLFAKLQALPLLWHQDRTRGNVIALATYEIEILSEFLTDTLVSLLPRLLTAAGATLILLAIDPALALLVPILIPGFFISFKILGRRLRGLAIRLQEQHATVVSTVEEMLDLLPVIKSFNAQPFEQQRYDGQIDELRVLSSRQGQIYAVVDPLSRLVVAAATVVLLVLAGQNFRAGEMSLAEAISFLIYVPLLVQPVSQLSSIYGEVQSARGTLARLEEVMTTEAETLAPLPPAPPTGTIRFEDVSFAYPGRMPAVNGLDFEIRQGETVALLGENGAGKSTTIGLLLGFYRPSSGRITLGGQDITEMSLTALRSAVGYVPQNRHLRNASVRDNIALAAPEASVEAIEAAAKIAQAHEFITSLPQGYDTIIGDKGVKLSGGQQQRVALARALMQDPPVLILDEATSMYDLEGEAAFVAECRDALAGRTVILITHRPASLAIADRVLRLEAGRIVAVDRPETPAR